MDACCFFLLLLVVFVVVVVQGFTRSLVRSFEIESFLKIDAKRCSFAAATNTWSAVVTYAYYITSS